MKANRRKFMTSLFGGAAALVAAPAAAVVPAVVNKTPADAAPVFNEMMRKLSAMGGGILKAAADTYHTYSPLRLYSNVTLDLYGARIECRAPLGPAVEVSASVKNVGMQGGCFVFVDPKLKSNCLQLTS